MDEDNIKTNSQVDNEEIEKNANENKEQETVEELKKKISELEKALVTLNDSVLREKAENENIRKRAVKELEDAHKYALSGFARDLIDGLENLYRAVESMDTLITHDSEQIKNLCEGVLMTKKTLLTAFEKNGLTRLYPINELFDHNYHQAVSQIEDAEKENNTVVQVIRAGYKIKDRLLQPALVTVTKKS